MTCGLAAFLLLGALAWSAERKIVVHGHRGARAVLPENTLPAFRHAIEAGADFIELDLAVTRDDVPVVSHDPVLNPEICTAPGGSTVIRELTLAEVRRWDCGSKKNPQFPNQKLAPGAGIPTLDEVLELAPLGSFGFNIEAKSFPDRPRYTPSPERFARLIIEAVRERELEARVIVQSFDWRVLKAMDQLAPEFRLAALYDAAERDFVSIGRETRAGTVAPQFRLVTPEKVRAAHDAGLQVVPWTANTPEEWARLMAASVDGIITDDPAALIAFLKQRGFR